MYRAQLRHKKTPALLEAAGGRTTLQGGIAMTIIDHLGPKGQCCQWEIECQEHHDVWLGRLRHLTVDNLRALISDLDQQAQSGFLPASIIPMIDIEDFAHDHSGISVKAVMAAEELSFLARNPLMSLMGSSMLTEFSRESQVS